MAEFSPLVGIVIVNFNTLDQCRTCLTSIAELHYQPRFTIVVDNNSPDGSGRLLRNEFESERTLFILSPNNDGYAAGNNLGAALAIAMGAHALWFLNPDTVVDTVALSELVAAMKQYPEGAGFGSKIYYQGDQRVLWGAGGTLDITTGDSLMRGAHQLDSGQFDDLMEVSYLPGCSLLVPTSKIHEVGLMPERFFMYFEDTDWSVRARKKGMKLYCVPKSIVWHDTDDRKLQRPLTVYFYNRNRLEFWFNHGNTNVRWRTVKDAVRGLVRAVQATWHASSPSERAVFWAHLFANLHFLTRSFGPQQRIWKYLLPQKSS